MISVPKKIIKGTVFLSIVITSIVISGILSSNGLFKEIPQKAQAATTATISRIVNIDFSQTKPVPKTIWGGNFYPVSSTAQGLYDRWNSYSKQALRDLGIKLIRYPGGWLTNATAIQNIYPTVVQPNNTPWKPLVGEWKMKCGSVVSKFYMPSLDQVATLSAEIGADILFEVSLDYKRLGTSGEFCSAYGESQLNSSMTDTEKAAKVKELLKADLEWVLDNYPQLRILELGNEPWEAYTVDDYASVAKEFADIIKKHDPSLQVILVGVTQSTISDTTWNIRINRAFHEDRCGTNHNIPCYDSISIHPYIRHGYSNPDDWLIPTQYPPIPSAMYKYPHIPDYPSPILMPLIQYRRQMLIDSTLQKAIDIVCPYSVRTNSYKWTHCTPISEIDFSNYRGVGNEKYKSISTYTYFNDGNQYFREILISNDSPPRVYQRDCPVDPQTGINCSSAPWSDTTSTFYYVKGGVNAFDFTGYAAVVYADNQNHQWIREVFVNETTSYFQRNCKFINADKSDCGDWQETNTFQTAVKGVALSIVSAYVPCPTCYNNYSKNAWGYTLQETFLLENGGQGYERSCTYDRVNNAFSCPGFSGPHPGFSRFLTPFDGVDDEKYTSVTRTMIYSDNPNLYDMPANFPGIDAVFGAKENVDHYTYTADTLDIDPSQLQITEWHNNCWSTLSDYSVLSVEEAFYIGENILQMAKLGIPSAVFHDITEGGSATRQDCSFFKQQSANSYTFRPSGQSFALTSMAAGGEILGAEIQRSASTPTPIPTIFRCPPKSPDCLSGGYSIDSLNVFPVVSEDKQKLHIFVFNRDTNPQEIQYNFTNQSAYHIRPNATYDVKTLDGRGKFTNKEFIVNELTNQPLSDPNKLVATVPPVSIARYSLPLAPNTEPASQCTGITVSPTKKVYGPGETVTLTTSAAGNVSDIKVRWISSSRNIIEQPFQSVDIPGTYNPNTKTWTGTWNTPTADGEYLLMVNIIQTNGQVCAGNPGYGCIGCEKGTLTGGGITAGTYLCTGCHAPIVVNSNYGNTQGYDMKQYMKFDPGSYWIYEGTASGKTFQTRMAVEQKTRVCERPHVTTPIRFIKDKPEGYQLSGWPTNFRLFATYFEEGERWSPTTVGKLINKHYILDSTAQNPLGQLGKERTSVDQYVSLTRQFAEDGLRFFHNTYFAPHFFIEQMVKPGWNYKMTEKNYRDLDNPCDWYYGIGGGQRQIRNSLHEDTVQTPVYSGPALRLTLFECGYLCGGGSWYTREDWFFAKDIGRVQLSTKHVLACEDVPSSGSPDPDCSNAQKIQNPDIVMKVKNYYTGGPLSVTITQQGDNHIFQVNSNNGPYTGYLEVKSCILSGGTCTNTKQFKWSAWVENGHLEIDLSQDPNFSAGGLYQISVRPWVESTPDDATDEALVEPKTELPWSSTIEVASTGVSGDANMDGNVDGLDYAIWLSHYGQSTTNGQQDGDFNSDGAVDGPDYIIWLDNYNL